MKLVESKKMEIKEKYTPTDMKTISAFSNDEGGTLVLGASDSGIIIGLGEPIKTKLNIENIINDSISPLPMYELELFELDNKTLLKITVEKGNNGPYFYKSMAYTRKNTSTIPMDSISLTRLALESKNLSYDQLPSKNKDLTFVYLERMFKKTTGLKNLEKNNLISIGLINDDTYNIAAELLADKNDLINSYIDIAKFKLDTDIFDERILLKNKSILEYYDVTIEIFEKYYKKQEIVRDVVRKVVEPVPFIAFKEALNNAIIHRDYLLQGGIQIAMFDNRIEVISPGGLPKGITEEIYLRGLTSRPRNQILSFIFFRLGFVEQFGTGINRIIKSYYKTGSKPYFELSENQVKVILPVITFNYTRLKESDAILAYLNANPKSTRSKIEDVLLLDKTTLIRKINELIDLEIIIKEGSGPSTNYSIK